jgi:hypothetical protein
MLPPDGVLIAAKRWIELLKRGESVDRGWAIIRNSPRDVPLTATQYATALEWLSLIGVIGGTGVLAAPLLESSLGSVLFARCVDSLQPSWLLDADILIAEPDDLPLDAGRLADLFTLTDEDAYLVVQNLSRKVDLEARAQIGACGELALIKLLEEKWPGSTTHIAAFDDSAGYDIAVDLPEGSWHLEVKTTTRKGRLTVHLSRNEYAIGRYDANWAMVVVGLQDEAIGAIATVRSHGLLATRIPRNVDSKGRWEVSAIDLGEGDLVRGLVLGSGGASLSLVIGARGPESEFLWAPN